MSDFKKDGPGCCSCGPDYYHVLSPCCPSSAPVPRTLHLTVDYPFGTLNENCLYEDATLTYYPALASPIPACPGYRGPFSDGWWSDRITNRGNSPVIYRYYLICGGSGSLGFALSTAVTYIDPALYNDCYPGSGGGGCGLNFNWLSPPGGASRSTCSPFLLHQDPPTTNPDPMHHSVNSYSNFTISG